MRITPTGSRPDVPELLGRLVAELGQRGVEVEDARAFPTAGVLRAAGGLTVWCYGRLLRWRQEGKDVIWPAADSSGAALRLAELVAVSRSESDRYIPAGDDSEQHSS